MQTPEVFATRTFAETTETMLLDFFFFFFGGKTEQHHYLCDMILHLQKKEKKNLTAHQILANVKCFVPYCHYDFVE